MLDTKKQNKPVNKIKCPISIRSDPKKHQGPQASSIDTGIAYPFTPQGQSEPTEKRYDSNQGGKVSVAVLALLVSVLALIVSVGSCRAARRSADVAAASVRAWIVPTGANLIGVEGDHINFKIFLKNAGNTPATAVVVEWGFIFVPGPDQTLAPEFHECPIGGTTKPGVIEAQGQWPTTISSIALSEVQLKMIADRTGRLYIYGCAKYHDVLDPEKERLTEVAFVYPAFIGEGMSIYAPYTRMR